MVQKNWFFPILIPSFCLRVVLLELVWEEVLELQAFEASNAFLHLNDLHQSPTVHQTSEVSPGLFSSLSSLPFPHRIPYF